MKKGLLKIDTSTVIGANNQKEDSNENLIKSIENRLNSYRKNPAHLDSEKQQKLLNDMKAAGYQPVIIYRTNKELNKIREELSPKAIYVQRYLQKMNSGSLQDYEIYDEIISTMKEYMIALKYNPKKIDKVIRELASRRAGVITYERLRSEVKDKNLGMELSYADPTLTCPKCSSTHISVEKKGFSLGKAAAGGFVLGAIGLLGGLIGKDKPINWCSSCGHRW